MFRWRAIYKDDTELNQVRSDGSRNKYLDIQRDKLKMFIVEDEQDNVKVALHFVRPSQKLIYRQRVGVHVLDGKESYRVWIVGWQENRNGINVQVICFVFEDGHVEVLDRFREDHALYAPIKFVSEEMTD